MNISVALVGVSGYAGSILYQLLLNHPNVGKIVLYGKNNVGKRLSQIMPALVQYNQPDPLINVFDTEAIVKNADIIFFACPAGVTKEIALPLIQNDFPVIDLSGDFRLHKSENYEKWYHKSAAAECYLKKAAYGLAELHHPLNHYVANPGCYATAVLLGLAPLVKNNLIDLDTIIVDAKSGVSGAGKSLSPSKHFVSINENSNLYKINQHQHIPEIVQELQLLNPKLKAIQFTTTLLPITRGLMATIYAKVPLSLTEIMPKVNQAFMNAYKNEAFIKLYGQNFPSIKDVVGSNLTAIAWEYNPRTRILLVDSVIDNLLKGAAGQAVQNLNRMFGFGQLAGLPMMPEVV